MPMFPTEVMLDLLPSFSALGLVLGVCLSVQAWAANAQPQWLVKASLTAVFVLGVLLVMSQGVRHAPSGLYYDFRAVLLVSAVLFLPLAGSLSVLVATLAYRFHLGPLDTFLSATTGLVLTWLLCHWIVVRRPVAFWALGGLKRLAFVLLCAAVGAVAPFTAALVQYFLSPQGLDRWPFSADFLEVQAVLLVGQLAGTLFMSALLFNLQDRVRAYRAFQQQKERTDSVLAAVPDTILVQDQDGRYLEVLSTGPVMVAPAQKLLGHLMDEFLPEAEVTARKKLLKSALAEGKKLQQLYATKDSNGQSAYRDLRVVPLDSTRALVLIRDLTELEHTRLRLTEKAQKLALVLDSTLDLLVFVEPDDQVNCLTASRCAQFLGCSDEDLDFDTLKAWVEPRHRQSFFLLLEDVRKGVKARVSLECGVQPLLGEKLWLDVSLSVVLSEAPGLNGKHRVLLSARDITRRKALEVFERMGMQAFESLSDSIVVIDGQDGRIQWSNPAFAKLTGYEPAEGHNQRLDQLLNSAPSQRPMPASLDLVVEGTWRGEFLSQTKDGRWFPEHRTVTFFEDELSGRTCHVVFLRDLTGEREQSKALKTLASRDSVTGLLNRNGFLEALRERIQKTAGAQPRSGVAVLTVDLAHFSNVNKGLGRSAGDQALQQVGVRLTSLVPARASVCRVESDEFALMMSIADTQQCDELADAILELFKTPFELGERPFFLNANVGMALTWSGTTPAEALLHESHLAVEELNARGEGLKAHYTERISSQSHRALQLESHLRTCLSEDTKGLYLKFQPKVFLPDLRPVGVEALCRWTHPELGEVSPAEFIPVAEQSSLIDDLGLTVFEMACQQIRSWTKDGVPPLPVAVNLSVRQLRDPELPQRLVALTRRHGVLPSMLELEVTESGVMRDRTAAIESLQKLRRFGFRIALDDFGTGYSSMAYLQTLPLDTLKLDRSFVHSLTLAPESDAICKAILGLAKSLSLFTVAEGVETEAQKAFLSEHGCDAIQGYLFSPAVSAEELVPLLAANS